MKLMKFSSHHVQLAGLLVKNSLGSCNTTSQEEVRHLTGIRLWYTRKVVIFWGPRNCIDTFVRVFLKPCPSITHALDCMIKTENEYDYTHSHTVVCNIATGCNTELCCWVRRISLLYYYLIVCVRVWVCVCVCVCVWELRKGLEVTLVSCFPDGD